MSTFKMDSITAIVIIAGMLASSRAFSTALTNKTAYQRIVGGVNTVQGELPYQTSLQRNGFHVCGASLVIIKRRQVILTAAHCVNGGTSNVYTVIAGEHNTLETSVFEQTRHVTRIIIHGNFNTSRFANDIAILSIETPFQLNRCVAPVPLPRNGKVTRGEVIISGWGTTSFEGPTSPILQKVQIPVVNDSACLKVYGGRIPGNVRSILCAGRLGEGGRDACQGDSGGPVVAVNGGYLAGIVSTGVEFGHPKFPGLNTEVSFYINWLESNVQPTNFPLQQLIANLFQKLSTLHSS